jgi:hypothetical protein
MHENVQRLRPEFWWQKNWLLHHDNTRSLFFFHQGTFDQKQHDCHTQPTLFAWLGPLWLFFISPYYDTIEVIKAESQMVLNTFTEQDSQDAF